MENEQRGSSGTMTEVGVKPVIYTQPDCPGCENVRRFLNSINVSFVERNIVEDEEAFEEFQEIGRPATPVVLIGGAVIWGFNKRKILRALNLPTS